MFCVDDDDDGDDSGDDDLMITKWKGECFSTTGGKMRKRRRFREHCFALSSFKTENEFSETQSLLYSRAVREAFPKILERETYLNSSAVISIILF